MEFSIHEHKKVKFDFNNILYLGQYFKVSSFHCALEYYYQ